ncbi:RagB/SusD family nutrient uptake outer membrane protein [Pedobacter foliorum]|uniref:RagB/SusD family nutrient uptake outer membrane protein n=1 Tax=Pedobacter foliorum TaxID=2739058 RepID=UPI0015670260|nr:RagB/SusD family nutrient uptake outer membrane protein [Pedobacter foliorum]NRF40537.1 RagB/SusD family nutrient uptake outer membrane protein [Pedobacter foliorum]
MKKYMLSGLTALIMVLVLNSCKKYLDVVPDNVATIDNAFTMRSQAEKFLFTCYSYIPREGNVYEDPAMLGGDELWQAVGLGGTYPNIARGFQNLVNPYGDNWETYYRALRDCNIFLENIDKVPDLKETEKRRWIGEVKFLKAYYHYYMVRMYGPIPLVKKNLPVDATVSQVQVFRAPVDSCFNYITELLDEAIPSLPESIDNPTRELGRVTQLIALSVKAKVLVTAASPLFNGNTDQASLKNSNGTQLFSIEESKEKWDNAAKACKIAIDKAHELGLKLYKYQPDFQQFELSDTIVTQLSIRNAITQKWNSEVIWGNTQVNTSDLQALVTPFLDPRYLDQTATKGLHSPTLKMAELFYSQHGVPISEDPTWDYAGRYKLRTAIAKEKKYIRESDVTAALNYDREPRFYADLGFDSGIWYGQGKYDDSKDKELFALEAKYREAQGAGKAGYSTFTGYYVKKLVHFQNVVTQTGYSVTSYPWTVIRLADLYLLYAEALNEFSGPSPEVHTYIDKVRERAGLNTVQASWTQYSTNPDKFNSLIGMRNIIHQERLIELAFEGQRFWDLRRWKEASKELNSTITGWDISQSNTAAYYVPKAIFNQTFNVKDYFWPIKESNITVNRNLKQNLGW